MNNDIISLRETSADIWQAKYRGNYGTYNIKIKMDGNKTESFSCSCPSEYYPCKHIAIIESAIDEHITEHKVKPKENEITVEELLKNVSREELIDFVVRQAKYNPELTNTILLEFLRKSKREQVNNYTMILRKALSTLHFDYDDLYEYHEDPIEIDILDEWYAKATEFILQKRFDEVIEICKAYIEEYAAWMEEIEDDIIEYIDITYQEKPYELLKEVAKQPEVNVSELYRYCITEMPKKKYAGSYMHDQFNNLLMELTHDEKNAAEFIALQDKLLQSISDKSSYQAEKIIGRKIELYKKKHQTEIAWRLITENIQIEAFRKQVTEQKIADKKFTEAKKLIADFLSSHQNDNFHYRSDWYELQLIIAQAEHDIPVIRKISFAFIENHFQAKYYRIFKSSFITEEWKNELENIISHYEKKEKYFSNSVADVLAEEKDAARLMAYIEKHLSAERIANYYSHIVETYPKETLGLFRKAIDNYAEKNTGRNHYEYIMSLFKKITRIKGGKELIHTMIMQYKNQYKNRRAMMEILNKVTANMFTSIKISDYL